MKSSARPKTGKRHPPGVPSQHDSKSPWIHDKYIPMSKSTEYSSVYIPHHSPRKEKHHALHKEASEFEYSATSVGDFLSTTQIHRRYYGTPSSGSKPGTPSGRTPSFLRDDSSTCFSTADFIPPYFRSFSKASNLPGAKSKTRNVYFTRYSQSAPTSRPSTGYDADAYAERPFTTGCHQQNFRPQSGYREERPYADTAYGYPGSRPQTGYADKPPHYSNKPQQSSYYGPGYDQGSYGYSESRAQFEPGTEPRRAYENYGTPPGYNGNPPAGGVYTQFTEGNYYIPQNGVFNESVFTQEEVNDQFSALKTEVIELHKVDNQGEWNFSKECSRFEKTTEDFVPASSFGDVKPDLKNKPNPLLKVKETTKTQDQKPTDTERSPVIEEVFEDKPSASAIATVTPDVTNTSANTTQSSQNNSNFSNNTSTISLLKVPLEVTLTSQTSTNLSDNGSVEEVEVEIHGSKTRTIITKPNSVNLKSDPKNEPNPTPTSEEQIQNSQEISEDDDFIKVFTKDFKAIKGPQAKALAKCRIQQILYEARFLPEGGPGTTSIRKNRKYLHDQTSGDGFTSENFSLADRESQSDSVPCEG